MITLLALAAAMQAPATAATPQTLQSVPGAKIHYYDINGSTGDTIKQSLNSVTKSQPKTAGQLYTWTVSINVTNDSTAGVCRITSAKAALDANVYLPRLTDEARVQSDVLQKWKAYEGGLEKTALDNLTFVVDRLPAIEHSLVGKPCDQAATLWNGSVQNLMKQQEAFDRKHSRATSGGDDDFSAIGRSY